jgi:Glycosyl hydrolases family 18
MRRRITLQAALAAAATTAATIGLAATGAGASAATGAAHAAVHPAVHSAATPLPAHVFAPYYEAYATGNPLTLSRQSGDKYLSFAFLQTPNAGSCTADWNGSATQPVAHKTFGYDIAQIQADGGNVIPSFGGYGADSTGTDIADSCTSVSKIAQAYEKVITTYNVPRIDLDVESNSLTDTAGINRRNEAVAEVESWAAASGRSVQFSYTLPTTTTGLDATELPILQNAIADGATISTFDLLTFDYYIGTEQNMVQDTKSAVNGLYGQLQTLYPADTPAQLWEMIGVTEMPGIDDFGPDETFHKASAATILDWAQSKHLGLLSFWALQRDNGSCPGTKGAGACSGLNQPKWFFSHTFQPFTS